MSVQERLNLSTIVRRLFTTAPEVVIDAIVGVTAGTADDPMLLLGALHVGQGTVVDALLGFTAPDDWLGIGVIAGDCTVTAIDSKPGADPVDGRAERSRVVYLLDRSGDGVTALGSPTEEPTVFAHGFDGADGNLVDICHRSLGLPTAGPRASTAELIGAVWLDRVADLVLGSDDWPGWSAIARLHPGVEPFGEIPGPERLTMLADDYVARTSWARARAQVTLGRLQIPGVDAGVASWMDVGMFSRWAERSFIDSDDLLGAMTARFGDLIQPIRFVAEASRKDGKSTRGTTRSQ